MNASFTADGHDPVAQFRLGVDASHVDRADLLFGGSLFITTIRELTFAGLDFSGNSFAPYSKRYELKKARSVGPGVVNLFGIEHHTHMLNALQVLVDGDSSFAVGIYSNAELEQRARVHNEGLTVRTRRGAGKGKPRSNSVDSVQMPQRRWLDATPETVHRIEVAIGERVDERLRNLQ